jgi:hypothetical protein
MCYFSPKLTATTVRTVTFLVTDGLINLQETCYIVSGTAVRLINDMIKGSDPKSDASVSAAER